MAQGWPSVDLDKPSVVPRGVDCTGFLPRKEGELPPPPAAAHSMMRAHQWILSRFGHGPPTDLTNQPIRAAVAANPDIVVLGTAAASTKDVSRFHDATGQVSTRTALTGFVATQQQRQHMDQSLREHGFDQHARSMRTPASVTVTPIQYSGAAAAGPYSGAPLALPASTWGAIGPVVLNMQHRQPQGAAPSLNGAAALVEGAGQAAVATAEAGPKETPQERDRRLARSRSAINRDKKRNQVENPGEAKRRREKEAERGRRRRREAKEAKEEAPASASRES